MKEKKVAKHKKAAKGFIEGFKAFITKGSVIDLAVAVIIGGAFGKIVTSLVNDIIMPPIGLLIGGVDFKDLRIELKPAEIVDGEIVNAAVNINYGNFVMLIIEFLIIAFAIYTVLTLVIRRKAFMEKLEAEENAKNAPAPVVETPEDIKLLREIRDLLDSKNK